MSDFTGKTKMPSLVPPFPYFGSKGLIASEIWDAFGDVEQYVEPFAGSLAVLLARPEGHKKTSEVVNDKDHYIANFFRALRSRPLDVYYHCEYPVNEDDLHARHYWLITEGKQILEKIPADPKFYDARIAGWWVWGICQWLGHDWCSERGPWRVEDGLLVRSMDGRPGIKRKLPSLGETGRGICRPSLRSEDGHILKDYLLQLAQRLRYVRVAAGDWSRVVSPAVLSVGSSVGVFLDPPYSASGKKLTDDLYTHDEELSQSVMEWALANGDNRHCRIALCGYEGEYDMPDNWTVMAWKGRVGYQGCGGKAVSGKAAGKGVETPDGWISNPERERVWFSPHCLLHPRLF